MKILNLYAGIGGNRKLWGDEHEITAVEYDHEIASIYHDFFPDDLVFVADAHQFLLENYKKYDFIWSSFPCQTHSRARYWGWKNDDRVEVKYPDLGLYQEIIFLKNYFDYGKWIVENTIPFYEPLTPPSIKLGRHLIWSNFNIPAIETIDADIKNGKRDEWQQLHGFDISGYKLKNRKDQILRNCVHPATGLHILNCAMGVIREENVIQTKLF